ncbi:trypsin-like peptidase domain-containing protein [Prosthecobacter sp.]|uniref:trypsin-like peptidase domain-containing protein n=1 Tax=Prosthecobacter sp. TaxID=1965333 RepID=UPI002ABA8549|nr:trypsin-like peptidase domain-containing protein [Prosthecobacter sp.]MDZ4401840.1 SHD1 domain-containing protein [Prosthecobacter sp.]
MNWRNFFLGAVMACASASAREWRSADGSRTVEAEFAGMKEGKLLLKSKDGKSTVFPAAAFSKEDQQFSQQAQVTLEAAVKAGALNMQADQVLPEGLLCRIINELPNQKGTWVGAGAPFLVLRGDDLTTERGAKVMGKTLYHAGTRTFQALDGTSTLINAYSLSLDDAVNAALQIQIASGGDAAKQAPPVREPLIVTITTRGMGLPVGKGFFITDAAILKDAKTIVLHHAGQDVPAKVVKTDDELGLALLSCAVEVEQGKFLPRKPLELGQNIFAVALTTTGKTFSTPPLTKGIISRMAGADSFEHDAAIDEKTVGGYVIGEKGDVLGVFFSPQSRVLGKRSTKSASSADKPVAKALSECLRSEALEKLYVEKDKDGREKRVPGVPSLKPGTNGDEMELAVATLKKSSVIVVTTREESKAPPPAKAAGTDTPPGGGGPATGWSLSSSGTRHNAKCRFYNAANACQATDGKPCKVCGG